MGTSKHLDISLRQLLFIVATRAALGVGVGMLVSRLLPPKYRRGVGIGLAAIGGITTVPAAALIRRALRAADDTLDAAEPA